MSVILFQKRTFDEVQVQNIILSSVLLWSYDKLSLKCINMVVSVTNSAQVTRVCLGKLSKHERLSEIFVLHLEEHYGDI